MAYTQLSQLNVTSNAFPEGGIIPKKYSCEGSEVSPPLTVHNIPAEAKSVVIIVHDPDAPHSGGMIHWIGWNFPLNGEIMEDYKGGVQGKNGGNKNGYMGMCPPDGIHHYHFYAYALDIKLELDSNADKTVLDKAMAGHIISQGKMVGLFGKS